MATRRRSSASKSATATIKKSPQSVTKVTPTRAKRVNKTTRYRDPDLLLKMNYLLGETGNIRERMDSGITGVGYDFVKVCVIK